MIDITRIPNAPAYVEGVVNLRGKIIPIVSLRTKLGLGEADRDKATRIMVVEIEGSDPRLHRRFGIRGAQDTGCKMEPPPSITGSNDSAYIEGVINLADRILILLDLKVLFGDRKEAKLAA